MNKMKVAGHAVPRALLFAGAGLLLTAGARFLQRKMKMRKMDAANPVKGKWERRGKWPEAVPVK